MIDNKTPSNVKVSSSKIVSTMAEDGKVVGGVGGHNVTLLSTQTRLLDIILRARRIKLVYMEIFGSKYGGYREGGSSS